MSPASAWAARLGGGDERIRWALAACAGGLAAGLAAGRGPGIAAALVVALAGVCVAAAVIWRLEAGIWLILLALPLDQTGRVLSQPIVVTVYQLVLVLTLASWGLRILAEGKRWLRLSAVDVGILALIGAALWSLPGSLAPSATMLATARLVFLWLFTLVLANAIREPEQMRRVVWVFIATGVAVSALAIVQYLVPGLGLGVVHSQEGFEGELRRAGGFFRDPNYFAGFASAALMSAGALLAHARRWPRALVCTAAAGVIGVALLVSFSRTGWVGALVGCVAVAVTAPPRRRVWLVGLGLGLALLLVAVAPGAIVSRFQSISDVNRDRSVATRYYMVPSTVDIIRAKWVFGTGLGAYEKAYPAYRRPGTYLTILKPHELPLAMWAEMGIAGLLAEVLLFGSAIVAMWRRRPRGFSPYESVAVSGLVALSAQTLFQYYLYFEYLWFFLALAIVSTRIARQQEGAL